MNIVNAANFDEATYRGDGNLNYPLVILNNAEATAKINTVIRDEISRFVWSMEQQALDNGSSIDAISVDYEIPCNDDGGLLSIVFTEYVNFERSAHPSTFRRALNFNSDSGDRITADSLSEIAHEEFGESSYSPKNLTRKLRDYAAKNGIVLYSDFQGLEEIPEDFYFDSNLHVHFIFQQYEVAPYAAGIIEFDATPSEG